MLRDEPEWRDTDVSDAREAGFGGGQTPVGAVIVARGAGDVAVRLSLAGAQLLAAAADAEIELAVEAALTGRGYDQALCVCRKGKITLFPGRALQDADAALLFPLILEISGIPAENIRISGY